MERCPYKLATEVESALFSDTVNGQCLYLSLPQGAFSYWIIALGPINLQTFTIYGTGNH